jgi:unsaturated chondroitin disaccharide hydrolase
MVGEPSLDRDALRAKAGKALEFAARQIRSMRRDWPPDRPAPVHTREGRWYRPRSLWTDWTPGFYAGQMWILARVTGEPEWRRAAEAHTVPLKNRRFDRDVHDLGFIFLPTYRRWHDALPPGDRDRHALADVLATAGTVQSFRWREGRGGADGFVYSFNGPQSLFIDTLMNVRLLFWAARHGAPPEVGERAVSHARTSLRHLVRRDGPGLGEEDGAVAHEAIFNAEAGRGEFRCLSTQQGYSPFTTWARGLAWSIYGFAEAFAWTGEETFLDAATRCAGFYLRRTPPDGVPYWDYGAPGIVFPPRSGAFPPLSPRPSRAVVLGTVPDVPGASAGSPPPDPGGGASPALRGTPRTPPEPLDSSAAAVTACGLRMLAGLSRDAEFSARVSRAASRIAETLLSDRFLAEGKAGEQGILLHGTYHRPRGWGVDCSVMWGDYFFLELLERIVMGDPDLTAS